MDATTQSDLLPLLTKLLATASPITLGSALTAFEAICPDDLASLHVHFRRLCRLLVDADEWGQLVALEVLMRYAKAMLERPETSGSVEPKSKAKAVESPSSKANDGKEDDDLDPDIELLLHCALPLFQSRNYAVVIATIKLFYELAPAEYDYESLTTEDISQQAIVQPLLKLADGGSNCARPEVSSIALEVCVTIANDRPWLLRAHMSRFLVRSRESVKVKRDKIRILKRLSTSDTSDVLMREFKVRHVCHHILKDANLGQKLTLVSFAVLYSLSRISRRSRCHRGDRALGHTTSRTSTASFWHLVEIAQVESR